MTTISREVTISCSPSRAFTVLTDVDRLPDLSEMTVAVNGGPGRAVATGDRFDQVIKVAGIELDTEWEVTEVIADALIRVEGRSKSNGRASLTQTLTAEGDGCRIRFEVDYDPPFGLLGDIADKVLFERRHEDEAEHILDRLKSMCEATTP